MKHFLVAFTLIFWSSLSALALTLDVPTQPENGVVWDQAAILSDETEAEINRMAAELEAKNSSEIGVATVENLQGTTIEDFSLQLARTWGIGQAENDNGLLLLVAPNDREVRIEVGYGLEGAIPDATASLIIQNVLVPAFQNGDYEAGILEATHALTTLAAGEAFEIPLPFEQTAFGKLLGVLPALLFIVWILVVILAHSYSWWGGGIVGGLFAGFIAPVWVEGWSGFLQFMVFGALAGLAVDFLVSRYWQDSIKDMAQTWLSTPGFGSDDDDHSGGSSSGGGGFGGGSFGGGGASGKW